MAIKSLLISEVYFPPQTGGISRFMESIVEVMGPEQICCLTGVKPNGCGDSANESHIYRKPLAFQKNKYIQAVGISLAMGQILLSERPQLSQLATIYDGTCGLLLKKWLGLPYVVYAHGNEILDVTRKTDWSGFKIALQSASRVLAVSQYTYNIVREAGVPEERIVILLPGCDAKQFHPLEGLLEWRKSLLQDRWNDRILLTVGGLVSRKGHDMVLKALPFVLRQIPDVSYVIVGDGPMRCQLQDLATSLGIADHVVFAGRIPDEELVKYYSLCNVFVMPSREQLLDVEGFGIVFLEANACEKPVIGGRSGGVSDAVLDNETGLLVDPQDPVDIANALLKLFLSPELAVRLGRRGRARVLKEFSWQRVKEDLDSVFQEVVKESKGQRGNA